MKTLLLVSLALGAMSLPAQDLEFGESVRTSLTEVRREPDAFKNVKIVFTIQFASLGKLSNPFFTQFTPTDYANFYSWAEEQPIWRQDAYEDLFGMLFYAKFGKQIDQLYKLQVYDRVEITGIVRNTFQGTPWIEVVNFKKLEGRVDLPILTHLYRGEQLMAQRKWARAIAELGAVDSPTLPPGATFAAYKNLGICYLRVGEAQTAAQYLSAAAQIAPAADFEVNRLLTVASATPGQEIDRSVSQAGLKDHERPMWEAFEGDGKARMNTVDKTEKK